MTKLLHANRLPIQCLFRFKSDRTYTVRTTRRTVRSEIERDGKRWLTMHECAER